MILHCSFDRLQPSTIVPDDYSFAENMLGIPQPFGMGGNCIAILLILGENSADQTTYTPFYRRPGSPEVLAPTSYLGALLMTDRLRLSYVVVVVAGANPTTGHWISSQSLVNLI